MRMSSRFRQLEVLVIVLLVTAACAVSRGENEDKGPQAEKGPTFKERLQKPISVSFMDTEIDYVISVIAKKADMDIVKSPKVTGRVTATLTDVPLEEALHHILAAHGYTFVASENMMRIVPAEEVTEELESTVSRVYRITYANVTEVEAALRRFISQRGSISSNPGTSNIIVTDTESRIKAIDTFIEEIDRVTPQILVEARIYDVVNTDNFDLGFEWYLGSRTDYGEAGVMDDTGTNPSERIAPFITGALRSGLGRTDATDGLVRFGILNESLDIDVLFSANQEKICAKLLASPRVLVLDNEKATFKIVEEIPYQELTQTAGGGNIGTTEFKDVGVELNVTPHVAREGMIVLHLNPKFSTETRTVSVSIPTGLGTAITSPQPVVANREANTRVLIRDGQTVVLGGLRKKDVTQESSRIPFLADLPVIGGLFKFEAEKVVNSELLVFITPRIVENPVLSQTESERFEATEFDGPECPPTKTEDCEGRPDSEGRI